MGDHPLVRAGGGLCVTFHLHRLLLMAYSKYRNVKTVVDGITFHSKREANRYLELKLLVKAKEISNLELQPKFPCVVNGILVCNYLADFRYTDLKNGLLVIEDTKGMKTALYKLKRKLMLACHGIDILET